MGAGVLKKLYLRVQHSTGYLHKDSEALKEFIRDSHLTISADDKMEIIAPFASMWHEIYEVCQFKKHIFSQRPEKYVEEGTELTDFNAKRKEAKSHKLQDDADIEMDDITHSDE